MYFKDGWVQTVVHIKVLGAVLLKCDVRPSYQTTSISHKPWVVLSTRGDVLGGHCNCMVG